MFLLFLKRFLTLASLICVIAYFYVIAYDLALAFVLSAGLYRLFSYRLGYDFVALSSFRWSGVCKYLNEKKGKKCLLDTLILTCYMNIAKSSC